MRGMDHVHPLKTFREQQEPHLSRRKLAVLLGVSTTSISRWEAGKRKPGKDVLPQIAEKTGIAPAVLRPDLAGLFEEAAE